MDAPIHDEFDIDSKSKFVVLDIPAILRTSTNPAKPFLAADLQALWDAVKNPSYKRQEPESI